MSADPDIDFDEFFDSYLETAYWSSNDESDDSGGEPLDKNYDPDDMDPTSRAGLKKEAWEFFRLKYGDISGGYAPKGARSHSPYAGAGHDFWLTRNGHGAGFWDGDWTQPQADRLTEASKKFGEIDLYVGDDGKVYASGHESARTSSAPPTPQSEHDRMRDFFFPKKRGSFLMSLKSWGRR